jgi:hypothetical protein
MANDHVAEPFRSAFRSMSDPLVEQVVHSQMIARKIAHSQLAVEVYGWAINNARLLPNDKLKELLDIICKEPD